MSLKLPSFSEDLLFQSLSKLPPAKSWLVGLSGGADSTALLYGMVRIRERLDTPFRAVHINHQLHPDADHWQQHCQSMCLDWSVPYTQLSVQIDGNGRGLEAEARDKRYAAIAAMLQPGEVLLTAHHADDQAETLLLNLMRGSGVDGLSAMPVTKTFGQHHLFRPLLHFRHQSLLDYLQSHGVEWAEDPSNQSLDQDRNFIRNKALPVLESQFSGTVKRLLLTQQAMAEARSLLETLAQEQVNIGRLHPQVFKVVESLPGNPALFKLTIRYWLKLAGVRSLPNRQLNELHSQIESARPDSQIAIRWSGFCLRLYQQCLWLQPAPDIAACEETQWTTNPGFSDHIAVTNLSEAHGSLRLHAEKPFELPGNMTICNRNSRTGLSLDLGQHHQSLKNLFQSASIPAWLRDSIPLLLMDDELAAVGDWALSQSFASWLSENHVKFTWQPNAPILQYLAQQQRNRL